MNPNTKAAIASAQMSAAGSGSEADVSIAEQTIEPRKVWRLFIIAAVVMFLGAVLQYFLPVWQLNPQAFLAINVVVELSRAALCFFIFGVRWMTRMFRVNSQSLFISSAFLSLGILTIARLLTFSGMPLAGSYSELVHSPYFGTFSNFSDSLYYDTLIRTSIGALLLVGALLPSDRRVEPRRIILYPLGFVAYAAIGLLVISGFDHVLPPLYIQGEGMTSLRQAIGFLAVAVTFAAALVYARLGAKSKDWGYVLVSAGLLVMTEAQFSFYRVVEPLDVFLLVGRTISLVAWFVIFMGIVKPSLIRPYIHLESAKREMDIATDDLAALSRSILERREAEEKILALNAELESKARELEASNKELESFCYAVSHDLRAPLRSIDGFSRFLMDEEGAKLSDHGKDYVTRLRNNCQRMDLIIDDLLKLSRVVRAELVLNEFDISALVKSVADGIRATYPSRKLDFSACGPVMVRGDENLLRIAMENLLQNAWKFTSKTENARVEFGVRETDSGRVFFIKDNGAGFDMKYRDKLFKPFERLHTESEFPGTGVGLASVQRVIQRHGGRIWAEGEVGGGATFYFTLGDNA